MIIRYKKTAGDAAAANAFEAYDDVENYLGEAVVEKKFWPLVFEKKPTVFTICESGDEMSADALLGAATAHALHLAREEEGGVCLRVEVKPEQQKKLSPALETLGFSGKSALLRMARSVSVGSACAEIPEGLTFVRDYLNDEEERRFYLERVNALFGGGWDAQRLSEARDKPNFTRLLLIDEMGAVGEAITWEENGIGVVDNIWVHPDRRRMGAGRCLMQAACDWWREKGLAGGYADIWSRLTPAMRMAAAAGFEPCEAVVEYPYMDVK